VTGRSKDNIIRGGENIACAHVERSCPAPGGARGRAVDCLTQILRAGRGGGVGSARAATARCAHATASWLGSSSLPLAAARRFAPVNATGKILRREIRAEWWPVAAPTNGCRARRNPSYP
jgi:long-chain acyl-CoA synthetase